MTRRPDYVPKYRKHTRSGKALVTFSNGAGQRRDYQLGDYGTNESRLEYRRLLAEWLASSRQHHPELFERPKKNCEARPFPAYERLANKRQLA